MARGNHFNGCSAKYFYASSSVTDDTVNGETLTVTVTAGTATVTAGVSGSGSHAVTIIGSLTRSIPRSRP
jgi:hypothetical protein